MTPTYENAPTPRSVDANTKVKKKTRKPLRLAVKIFLYFALFTFLVILILWLVQVVFLDDIYRGVKLNDIKKCADFIARTAEEDDIQNGVIEASNKYNSCITVYRITGAVGSRCASSHVRTSCMIHNIMSESTLNQMYEGAVGTDYYIERIELDIDVDDMAIVSGGTENPYPSTVVCAKAVTDEDGVYLILVDSEILPLSSTTRTLMYQLIYITLFLLLCAIIFSIIISNKIAKPFREMTDSASLLAMGRYDVSFDTDSFSEAKQLGDTLSYAAGELSKLDVMQKELIANISHDLRTPLTLISGYSEMMRDIPGEMTGENMQVVIDETARLSSLVSDLLELSKLTSGEQQPRCECFSITETVEETLTRYTKLVERDDYKITFERDCDAVIYADRTRVLQVIYNLVNNAINHAGDDKTVSVVQTVHDGKVRISVTDNGEGIPPDQLPMIWERYYKVRDFHKRAKVGTGLGLAIVKNVLLMHGADFGVTSKVGSGSTFWFEFELVSE